MMIILQDAEFVSNVERILTIKEISIVGILLLVIGYLVWVNFKQHKYFEKKESSYIDALEKKDNRIREAVENHLKDSKLHGEALLDVNKWFYNIVEDLKKIYQK